MGASEPEAVDAKSSHQAGSVGEVETRYIDLAQPLALDCGATLFPIRIAYESYGSLNTERDNCVLICHALSGDAHAAGWNHQSSATGAVDGFAAASRGRQGLGWWDAMIGPGKAFDTERYCVICTNLIGGCGGSTGPSSLDPTSGKPYGSRFPVLSVSDMVRAQYEALRLLGINRLATVAGASLGGMQAFEWAVRYPHLVDSVVSIASTARINPQGLAWNAIARESIMCDPKWRGGDYYEQTSGPDDGMGIGRMIGHITYLSAESMSAKFGRRLQDRETRSFSITDADYEVESYLRHQAAKFVQRFDANTYLLISRALTYFDLADHGDGNLERAISNMEARSLLISFSSDWLYPPENAYELQRALLKRGKPVTHVEIDAAYGHDSFLVEEDKQTAVIRHFLDGNDTPTTDENTTD